MIARNFSEDRTPRRRPLRLLPALAAAFGIAAAVAQPAQAQTPVEQRIEALVPSLESYVAAGMKSFDVSGLAIGIVAGDRLVYAKAFGTRSKGGAEPVDTRTVFQIGSTTKAFLAATMAIMVDRGKLRWDDRVVDLYPAFRMKDPWVNHEFRVFDLIAQRSGLPPYANDMMPMLGYSEPAMIRSLGEVDPITSFRTSFAYTNITHLLAARIVANAAGAADWDSVLRKDLLEPLGMKDTTTGAAAIDAAPNHMQGYRFTENGTVAAPFTQLFPYDLGAAGSINSTLDDMARWVRLQLGNGEFEGKRLVSAAGLAFTHTPKVGLSDKAAYAMGWLVQQTPNGAVVWHNGGTTTFGAYVGLQPERGIGVIVLSNEQNVGFPDAVGAWAFDRLLDNPVVDHVAATLIRATARAKADAAKYARPAAARPSTPLAALAGSFTSPVFGKLALGADGVLAFAETGAALKLEPWDGDIFTAGIVPSGRFAGVVANLGEGPVGFAQFQMDGDGKLSTLRLSFDGQAYDLKRE